LESVNDAAEGFMTKKVMAATEALEGGATAVHVGDANRDAPVADALGGAGTTIAASALADNGEITQ
jgi:acetylglutamate/LysW-gamma-L-alpha-aminoadipate kinase